MAISLIYYLLVLSALGYLIIILSLTIGWFRIKRFTGQLSEPSVVVSVVVAVRNEETNILKLLQSLVNQDYPESVYEVIVVNDHSEDKTKEITEAFISVNPFANIKLIDADMEGKKKTLSIGYKIAGGELILTTDGDCEMGPKWISRIVAFYQSTGASLMIAPVIYHGEKGFLQRFFSLDFMSLVASGAGSVGIGKPIIGNGANLAIKKEILNSYRSDKDDQLASGDDVFLIQHLAKSKGIKSIQFIRDPEVIVYTNPPSSVKSFFRQRIRWASKAKAYKSVWAIIVALVVFIFNTMLVISLMAGFIKAWMVVIFALFIVFKFLIDLPLLYEFTGFVNKRKRMIYLPVFELVYPFYIMISAVIGLFFRFEWKGRKGLR